MSIRTAARRRIRRAPDREILRRPIGTVERPIPARVSRREAGLGAVLLLGLGLLAFAASRMSLPRLLEERMEVVWEEPAPPPPPPEPEPPPEPPPKPPEPRPDPSPPPESTPPVEEPPPVFGLPEEATSESGDMAVATGNTLLAAPDSVVRPDPGTLAPANPAPPDLEGPYLEGLRREISRQYPSRARKLHIEGTLRLRLVLEKSGRILEAKLLQGSGQDVLDQGVLDKLDRLGYFAPFPAGLGRDRWELEIPVTFRLR
jgi:protein TonB